MQLLIVIIVISAKCGVMIGGILIWIVLRQTYSIVKVPEVVLPDKVYVTNTELAIMWVKIVPQYQSACRWRKGSCVRFAGNHLSLKFNERL